MGNTSVRCTKCGGSGVLLINISPDGQGNSFVEQPCDKCGGTGSVTRAALFSAPADQTLDSDNFMPIALTGAFRAVINGDIYDRSMTSRELYKLAHYALLAAMETDKYEKRRDQYGDTD
jgi:hypothetical protein